MSHYTDMLSVLDRLDADLRSQAAEIAAEIAERVAAAPVAPDRETPSEHPEAGE